MRMMILKTEPTVVHEIQENLNSNRFLSKVAGKKPVIQLKIIINLIFLKYDSGSFSGFVFSNLATIKFFENIVCWLHAFHSVQWVGLCVFCRRLLLDCTFYMLCLLTGNLCHILLNILIYQIKVFVLCQ